MWLTQLLARNEQCFPGRVAVIDDDRRVTWRELARRVHNLAGGLAKCGVRRGDRVAVLSGDRAEVVEAYFALGRLGAVVVPLTAGEFAAAARKAQLAAVLGEQALLAGIGESGPAFRLAFEDPLFGELAELSHDGTLPEVAADDLAAILYGSVHAKGVVVDHRSIKDIALGWLAVAEPSKAMVFASCRPLSHGSVVLSLAYLAAGATLVLAGGADADQVITKLAEHSATHVWLTPRQLTELLHAGAFHDGTLPRLSEVVYGGAPMPVEVYRQVATRFHGRFRQVYGTAEAGGPVATLGPSEHPVVDAFAPPLPEALPVGRVIPGMSARFVDADGVTLPPGSAGELCVRGDGAMRGYWNDPAATAEATLDGWVRTGDFGHVDEAGYLYLGGPPC
ncbi:Acyl-CoA synthetase (AMP-forming)/AMP-acid ligase II [Amycolatopsis xylanica]|uniref:Acyl-CoA synthetase (AMP-forming)/AMP-acid ligase II n=1 Tax=Amycolatopsis xylanica TaxID=589385 RepID=A0A1H2WAM2_9PSEU|nr:AMP-binding protein [Amycolatopsis xylanica]SDW77640.1 Acyl-CoA synthetase (AMP-forming)/AMP-acid ligase II [Amycolatopsis xylanica]